MNLCVLRVEEHPSKVKLDCNVLNIHLHRVRVREIKGVDDVTSDEEYIFSKILVYFEISGRQGDYQTPR